MRDTECVLKPELTHLNEQSETRRQALSLTVQRDTDIRHFHFFGPPKTEKELSWTNLQVSVEESAVVSLGYCVYIGHITHIVPDSEFCEYNLSNKFFFSLLIVLAVARHIQAFAPF